MSYPLSQRSPVPSSVSTTHAFSGRLLTCQNLLLTSGIFKANQTGFNSLPEESPIEQKFLNKLTSQLAPATKNVTTLTYNSQNSCLYIGFSRGYFRAFDVYTFEAQPDYELAVDPINGNKVTRIYGLSDTFYVLCAEFVIEYRYGEYAYINKYKLNSRARDILFLNRLNVAVDRKGKIYNFYPENQGENALRIDQILRRDQNLHPFQEIGKYQTIISLDTSEENFNLYLIQYKECIGILNLWNLPYQNPMLWAQRRGLSCRTDGKVIVCCSGSRYFYASIHGDNSVSDRYIYYNTLDSIINTPPDLCLQTVNGPIV